MFQDPKTREYIKIEPNLLYRTDEAAAFLKVEPGTVRVMIRDGRLDATYLGRYRVLGQTLLNMTEYAPPIDVLYTPEEVAAYLRYRTRTIHAMIRNGRLKAVDISGGGKPRYRVWKKDIQALLTNYSVK